ncbi:MAG TPA: AAA family ATPase [Nitrospirota bacterium]|nr:AAA family ATPase [Nitrospirota bacterium]
MITIPGYKVLRQLYEGNRAIVYHGWNVDEKKPVTIKTLRPEQLTAENIEALRHEYELSKSLGLEGIVRPYGMVASDCGPVLILEDFGGVSLKSLLNQRGAPLQVFLDLAIRVSKILSELHQSQIIHKNIRPSNIIVNPDTGQVKITNFSMSSLLGQEHRPDLSGGSLAYMSPEQTGRMNRSVDYRTDFYSLGVVFYQLLTGELPFKATDALALIHSHIAMEPEYPSKVKTGIPSAVSDIVMKLIAKNAEDRYQSGYGLEADLQTCLAQLNNDGRVERFELGTRDIPQTFTLSQKLYGRERQIESLMAAFDRIRQGTTELLLVTGHAGIGKTALINEIHKPILAQRGYFISGKYDQLKKNVPYSAVILAVKTLIRQILTESEERVHLWKERLTQALGVNGQIIVDVIPEVELIIGKQPALSHAGPTEALNRFNRVIQRFVGAFAEKGHPLVLFLDDLQWVDLASLNLIKILITDPNIKHFFVIGAYRDNEVKAGHPLLLLFDELSAGGVNVTSINLPSLTVEHVNQLIVDTLRCSPGQSEPLARIVYQKTGGSPFFVSQMLKVFYEEKMLVYEAMHGWRWSIDEISHLNVTDNVVDLLVGKISKLSTATQEILKLASCIGNRFDLETLAIVYDKSSDQALADLNQALREGLVIPANENFLFFHDRIQEAAYSLIPGEEKKNIHYKIGYLVLRQTKKENVHAKVFYIADQLNAGAELITDQAEKYELAALNLMAGKKAKASTAYAAAERYLSKGIDLLALDSWREQYALTLDLFMECSECRYLNCNFEGAEKLFDVILKNVRTNREKAEAYSIKTALSQNRGRSAEALEYGSEGLKLLGLNLPAHPGSLIQFAEILKIKWYIRRRKADDLVLLPEMRDPARQVITQILISMAPAAYFSDKNLLSLIMLKVFTITLRYGRTNAAPLGYATYGLILSAVLGKYQRGYELADLAVHLSNQQHDLSLRSQCDFILAGFVNHWVRHLSTSVGLFIDGHISGLESGNFVYAGYCAGVHTFTSLVKGDHLKDVQQLAESYLEVLEQIQNEDMLLSVTAFHRTIQALRGLTKGPTTFDSDHFDEGELVRKLNTYDRQFVLSIYRILKLPLLFLFDDFASALEMSEELQKDRDHLLGMYYLPHHNFYYSLTLTALYPTGDSRDKRSYWNRLKKNQKTMKTWANNCHANYLHKYSLVAAEMARLKGKYQQAEDLYDQAIKLARENEFVQEEAIANELAARFHLTRAREHVARAYLMEALSCYEKWGATAKVKQLEDKYATLFASTAQLFSNPVSVRTISAERSEQLPPTGSSALDLTAVLKSSQAISREISLDRLLRELMKIVMENAGARRGLLILERDGRLYLEAEGRAENGAFFVLRSLPVEGSRVLAESVVHYTARTLEAVVLNDAENEGMFTHDPYIIDQASKSILCTPIINKRRLTGILYLENDLTSHAFTPSRVEILDALSSQIAISLENATLYEESRSAKESLQESEQKFRTLAETMRSGIVIYREDAFLYVNPATESITGYSRDEFPAMDFSSIIHPDYLDLVRERAADRLAGRPLPEQYEFKIVRKDGEDRWVLATARRIEYGREKAMIATLLDVTDQKKAEQEQLRLHEENVRHYREKIDEEQRHQREKENILMDIHDGIGGITTNIGLLSEVARKALSRGDIKNSLDTISSLAREGTTEIRSLMFSLDSRDHSWRSLAAEMNSHGAKTFQPHAIAFEMITEIENTAAEPGGLLFLHLFRIYREALTNVIKHARATRVTVRLRVDQERLVLAVQDNGQGCDEAAIVGKGRGVNNMKRRASELGGSVTITAAEGMCISLEIPLSRISHS